MRISDYMFYIPSSKEETFKTIKEAEVFLGGLSSTQKMDCDSFGLPADECNIGSYLSKILGSVCYNCYAKKGMYNYKCVKDAQYRRLEILNNEIPERWIEAFVFIITKRKSQYFRWHDSGDLQNLLHLKMIVEIAKRTPFCKYWLPTREAKVVSKFLEKEEIPDNLVIRVSDQMIDKHKPVSYLIGRTQFSGVQSKGKPYTKQTCRASKHIGGLKKKKKTGEYKPDFGFCTGFTEQGEYVECRKCWDKSVERVNYPIH